MPVGLDVPPDDLVIPTPGQAQEAPATESAGDEPAAGN
jgi:hypothetical protein